MLAQSWAICRGIMEEMKLAHADGSLRKRLSQIAKTDMLILDYWGLSAMSQPERQDMPELIVDRTRKSTLITSQIPVKAWHEVIGEPLLAGAILDRLVHMQGVRDCYMFLCDPAMAINKWQSWHSGEPPQAESERTIQRSQSLWEAGRNHLP